MTLHEFHTGVSRYQRLGLILLGVTGFTVLTYGFVMIGFAELLSALGVRLFGSAHAGLIGPLGLVPVVVLMLAGSALIQRLVSKDRRVICPHCRRFLAGGSVRLVTIATRHCPMCGQRVIEEFNAEQSVGTDRARE